MHHTTRITDNGVMVVWAMERKKRGLTSISPLAGQAPYTLSTGSIQTAGHNQSLEEASETQYPLDTTREEEHAPSRKFRPDFHLTVADVVRLPRANPRTLYRGYDDPPARIRTDRACG